MNGRNSPEDVSFTLRELRRIGNDNCPNDYAEFLVLLELRAYDIITKRLEQEESEYQRQQAINNQTINSGVD